MHHNDHYSHHRAITMYYYQFRIMIEPVFSSETRHYSSFCQKATSIVLVHLVMWAVCVQHHHSHRTCFLVLFELLVLEPTLTTIDMAHNPVENINYSLNTVMGH